VRSLIILAFEIEESSNYTHKYYMFLLNGEHGENMMCSGALLIGLDYQKLLFHFIFSSSLSYPRVELSIIIE
jgi:hypothetical protein